MPNGRGKELPERKPAGPYVRLILLMLHPANFFLFCHLKGEMAGFTANSSAGILSEIRRIFQEIPKDTFVTVYDEWTTRFDWITEQK
jgi:hypothetical protein